MLPARRSALRSAQRLRSQVQRRFESSHGDGHAHNAHHHAEPVNETLGRNFFITLAALPIGWSVYQFTLNDGKTTPLFTRIIESYSEYKERWTARNTLHTAMVEQAAHDRNLFHSSPGSRLIDLKFPEQFNVGSPYNIAAGSQVDHSKLIEFYENKNKEMDEKIAERRAKADQIKLQRASGS